MKRGFTLLELLIVIIILGVLGTLGVMQYQGLVERARGAEARQILGQLRTQCAAIYMQDGNTTNCTDGNLGIGSAIPGPAQADCDTTHFFVYVSSNHGGNSITFDAYRCEAAGKTPNITPVAPDAELELAIDYAAGTDTWSSNAGY